MKVIGGGYINNRHIRIISYDVYISQPIHNLILSCRDFAPGLWSIGGDIDNPLFSWPIFAVVQMGQTRNDAKSKLD